LSIASRKSRYALWPPLSGPSLLEIDRIDLGDRNEFLDLDGLIGALFEGA
jgi:hypothetical protein